MERTLLKVRHEIVQYAINTVAMIAVLYLGVYGWHLLIADNPTFLSVAVLLVYIAFVATFIAVIGILVRRALDPEPNYGPMRPNDGMEWEPSSTATKNIVLAGEPTPAKDDTK